jgi:hypothetical protein
MEIKKMELKKIQFFEAGSEETNCYNAVVYINGKAAIAVQNDGHGGSDMQHPLVGFDRSIIDAANEFCKKNFPATVFLWGGKTKDNISQKDILYACLETWCGDQIHESLLRKDAKKLTTGKVSFVEGGQIWSIATKKKPEADIVAYIKSKYGDVPILNNMPIEQQIQALRAPRKDKIEQSRFEISYAEAIKVPA